MISLKRPYLILPLLIEQPTWGGQYILTKKKWDTVPSVLAKKIGQSYELYSNTKLLTKITDSSNPDYAGELGNADGTIKEELPLQENTDYVKLKELVPNMQLLIKFTQAAGNSFQLHVKPGTTHPRWKPKPESWYYLEDGLMSCGVKAGAEIAHYKQVCNEIDAMMKDLSSKVKNSDMTIEDARRTAKEKIKELNPWQFVNVIETKKGDLIDLSAGGVHHSWEENRTKFPMGNIVYEVQVDVMDPFCTIRSFDQGKIDDAGDIREIHVEDYFRFIDADASHNDLNYMKRARKDNTLLKTPYYSLDIIELAGSSQSVDTGNSFHHLFVEKGGVIVYTTEGKVTVTEGHSCFVPQPAGTYTIHSTAPQSVILKTYLG